MSSSPKKGYAHPSKQDRSRRTEARLLEAAVTVLGRSGLAGCSVPLIAQEAGVAVGTVYRRYPDKDRLLADAILSLFAAFDGEGQSAVSKLIDEAETLEDAFRQLCSNMIVMATTNRTLVLATRDFAMHYKDEAFQREYERVRGGPRDVLFSKLWARFGDRIDGGEFALRMALSALHGIVQSTWIDETSGLFDDPPEPLIFTETVARMQSRFLTKP